ncbi:MAG: alpha/beta hydrolase [Pseudomonadota bacterium]
MAELELDINQILYYEMIPGNSHLPVLVFLHEGLGCSAMWKHFAQALCKTTQCPGLMYDRLGYGRSSTLIQARTMNYLTRYAQDELPQVLNAIIPDHPYVFIGHSDGGTIALIAGAQKPPLLNAIITEAAHVFVEPVTLEGIKKADKAFDQGKLKGLYAYHGSKTHTIFKAWSQTWLNPLYQSWNIEALLSGIECPLLVIQGINDQYGTPKQVDSICSSVSGKAHPCLIQDCGHSPHSEQPEQVTALMSDFIQRVPFMKTSLI